MVTAADGLMIVKKMKMVGEEVVIVMARMVVTMVAASALFSSLRQERERESERDRKRERERVRDEASIRSQ